MCKSHTEIPVTHMQPMVLEYESQHLPHFYDPVL